MACHGPWAGPLSGPSEYLQLSALLYSDFLHSLHVLSFKFMIYSVEPYFNIPEHKSNPDSIRNHNQWNVVQEKYYILLSVWTF